MSFARAGKFYETFKGGEYYKNYVIQFIIEDGSRCYKI